MHSRLQNCLATAVRLRDSLSEEAAIRELSGPIDVYTSRFRPMKATISGRDERTFMKMLVHVPTNRVVGCHMVRLPVLSDCCCCWGCWRGAAGALVEGDVGVAG